MDHLYTYIDQSYLDDTLDHGMGADSSRIDHLGMHKYRKRQGKNRFEQFRAPENEMLAQVVRRYLTAFRRRDRTKGVIRHITEFLTMPASLFLEPRPWYKGQVGEAVVCNRV